jgi:hypothetical protein
VFPDEILGVLDSQLQSFVETIEESEECIGNDVGVVPSAKLVGNPVSGDCPGGYASQGRADGSHLRPVALWRRRETH